MRGSTFSLVLGAVACAAVATFLTKSWLAANSSRPPPEISYVAAGGPALATQPVVVAARALPFGTALTSDMLQEVRWPSSSIPAGAFTSKGALLTAEGARVVVAAIAENEPILSSKVTAPGQRASLSIVIGEGKKAVTIRVDDVLGVAGFVQPEDSVDILLTRSDRLVRGEKANPAPTYTDVLLQNVRVLAIDQIADRNTQAKPAKAVTVEVDTAQAQKLVLAASVGQLSLALRRAGWTGTSDAARIGMEDLPNSRPPEAAEPIAAEEPAPSKPIVTVTRATDRKQYEVEAEPLDEAAATPAVAGGEDAQTKAMFLGATASPEGASPISEEPIAEPE